MLFPGQERDKRDGGKYDSATSRAGKQLPTLTAKLRRLALTPDLDQLVALVADYAVVAL